MNRPAIQREVKPYALEIAGRDLYRICHLLEEVAIESNQYLRIREAVELAELMRRQARDQGWVYDTPRNL